MGSKVVAIFGWKEVFIENVVDNFAKVLQSEVRLLLFGWCRRRSRLRSMACKVLLGESENRLSKTQSR